LLQGISAAMPAQNLGFWFLPCSKGYVFLHSHHSTILGLFSGKTVLFPVSRLFTIKTLHFFLEFDLSLFRLGIFCFWLPVRAINCFVAHLAAMKRLAFELTKTNQRSLILPFKVSTFLPF